MWVIIRRTSHVVLACTRYSEDCHYTPYICVHRVSCTTIRNTVYIVMRIVDVTCLQMITQWTSRSVYVLYTFPVGRAGCQNRDVIIEIDCITTHIYLPTHPHIYLPTCSYLPTFTYIPTHPHIYPHAYTYLPTYLPTYLHTYLPTYLLTYLYTYLPT